ncbi:MAG: zonular occludens toxin domain-containing protein [Halopseudomonas sp.]|uniref:zonular occludens toxin domain-containing protein n=1 Tax=Halopseudomonas sp. TaxID=2901191 RepID=UPI003001B9B1
MAVYIVTGKLGAGKTLLCIIKILEYLKARRRVAVNVDVFMDKLCKPNNKHSRVVRLPDLPTADDLLGLGFGHETYDEERFGGIFLDEGGVWLNSRDWNQGGRTDLLKFFLFLRKRRWDLWLCVQHVGVIDKQVRESIAEHVVYLNRWDKMKVPFPFGLLGRIFSLGFYKGRLPKLHQAVVKYGAKFNSPKVEDIFYRGEQYYSYYDTTQEYNKDYDKGSYSMLPPGYWRRSLPRAPRNLRFYMRTTKIFFRRFRIVNAFFLGGAVAAVVAFPVFAAIAFIAQPDAPAVVAEAKAAETISPFEALGPLQIAGYIRTPDGVSYSFTDKDGRRIRGSDLAAKSIEVVDHGPTEAVLQSGPHSITVYR